MDYRNLPFKFGYGGLNLVASPENLGPGQYTYFQNVRYKRTGTLEARPGTEDFVPFFTQPAIGGAATPYPMLWNIGKSDKAHYIGKIYKLVTNVVTEIDGWMTFHATGSETGNATGYEVFINGVPVAEMGTSCFTWPAMQPYGYSVVRATSKTGIPVTLIDGTHYVINKECNINRPPNVFNPDYVYGSGSGPLPIFQAYKLGIATPAAPTVAVAAGAGLTVGDYYYAYSYYSSVTGFESAFTSSAKVTTAGGNLNVTVSAIVNFTDPQVDTIRIWRKGGTISNSWRLVTTLTNTPCPDDPIANKTYIDAIPDITIAVAEAFDTDTIAPFSTLDISGAAVTRQEFHNAWGPFNGKYVFWVGDPIKKGYIYWNKAGDLSRYNPLTSVTSVTDPGEELQNGFLFSSVPFVFSKLNLYGLDFGGPDALPEFTARLVPIGMGLAGKWAFAVGPNTMYFLGRDGIYATDCQPGRPTSITEESLKPIFQGATVNGLPPIDWSVSDTFRMAVTPKELHFFYTSAVPEQIHLVFDLERGAWSQWTSNKYAAAYHDEGAPSNRVIFGTSAISAVDKHVYSMDDSRPTSGTETFTVHVRTGSLDNGIPLTYKEYGALQIDGNYVNTLLSVTPYYNSEVDAGAQFYLSSIPGETRRDYPYTLGDYYARSICLDISWTESLGIHPILYQGNLLFREDEERLVHWEMPPTSLGIGGWYHLKDGYICLRSDAQVNLTVVIDGITTDVYPIASTGGLRLKRYVEFKPRRGKVFQFKLDSIPETIGTIYRPFRFYGEESLVNGKPWITGATYAPLTPFGAVGYAQYRRTEGGT